MFPAWSPTSDQIAYANLDLAGLAGYEIRRKPASMAGVDEVLLRTGDTPMLWDWSPDGKTLVYSDGADLHLLPLEGERKPQLFAKTPGEDLYAQFSPDGKWMAYSSGARGQEEAFVQPVPATGPLWQISTGGGTMPRWRRDGRELYYRAGDGRLMAVAVSATGAAFEPSATHVALFAVPQMGNTERFTYQPAADGKRFYVNVPVAGTSPPISVVLNWQSALKR
jgi:Tol biopolymer transport system component